MDPQVYVVSPLYKPEQKLHLLKTHVHDLAASKDLDDCLLKIILFLKVICVHDSLELVREAKFIHEDF